MNPDSEPPVRRHRRRTLRIVTRLEAGADSRSEVATTLGGGGLFIQTERPLPRNTPLVVNFALQAGGVAHRVPGRVAFCHAPETSGGIGRASGMGIEFTDADAAARVARELEALP